MVCNYGDEGLFRGFGSVKVVCVFLDMDEDFLNGVFGISFNLFVGELLE